jgi:hypothetical protein
LIAAGQPLVTGAEVPQGILRRYAAIGRREAIEPAFQAVLEIVDETIPIEKPGVLRAAEIAQNRTVTSARGALHIAVIERHGHSIHLELRRRF